MAESDRYSNFLLSHSVMMYVSTSGKSPAVDFRTAVIRGLAPDGGLYVPEHIPRIGDATFRDAENMTTEEMAQVILSPFTGHSLTHAQLTGIIRHAFNFDLPLIPVGDSGIAVLELFHGPTWAFKDAGAGFLAGCLDAWSDAEHKTAVLVATSGDTGGAVAHGFKDRRNTEVFILYPKSKISFLQEQQIAGLEGNIHAVAVRGTFDDCQRLVKLALRQHPWNNHVRLTSANSINIARWLPQMVFYAVAWQQARKSGIPLNVGIPSGNLGNFTSAMLLHAMGLRFNHLIATHNANDTFPRYLTSGLYESGKTLTTLANAMDVSDPGNFARFAYLMKPLGSSPPDVIQAQSVSDQKIRSSILEVWEQHQYLLDPHTATAWHAMIKNRLRGIIMATAHPFKFEEVIQDTLGWYPASWKKEWSSRPIESIVIDPEEEDWQHILHRYLDTKGIA